MNNQNCDCHTELLAALAGKPEEPLARAVVARIEGDRERLRRMDEIAAKAVALNDKLGKRNGELYAEVGRLHAIFDNPVKALFADGREATENERHLISLESHRRKEAWRAKEEARELREAMEKRSREWGERQTELLACLDCLARALEGEVELNRGGCECREGYTCVACTSVVALDMAAKWRRKP